MGRVLFCFGARDFLGFFLGSQAVRTSLSLIGIAMLPIARARGRSSYTSHIAYMSQLSYIVHIIHMSYTAHIAYTSNTSLTSYTAHIAGISSLSITDSISIDYIYILPALIFRSSSA